VDEFVTNWIALTHKPATMLAAILKKDRDVGSLTAFFEVIEGQGADGVKSAIAKALNGVDFFQSAIGRWIESVVPTTILAAVTSTDDWKTVQSLSGKALDIIKGKTLTSLIDYAARHLGIDAIQKIKTDSDMFQLHPWLQAKIAHFLGN